MKFMTNRERNNFGNGELRKLRVGVSQKQNYSKNRKAKELDVERVESEMTR